MCSNPKRNRSWVKGRDQWELYQLEYIREKVGLGLTLRDNSSSLLPDSSSMSTYLSMSVVLDPFSYLLSVDIHKPKMP